MKKIRAILAFLVLNITANAQDVYEFVDKVTGATNGPFVIAPDNIVNIGGRAYELRPTTSRFQWETNVIPNIQFTNATISEALDTVRLACRTNIDARLFVFRPLMITNRITLRMRATHLSEVLRSMSMEYDVTLLHDFRSEAVIMMPNSLSDGRFAWVLSTPNETYDLMIKQHGSFNKLLVEAGVLKCEEHALSDYDRAQSSVILYGASEVRERFESTFFIIYGGKRSGQQGGGGYVSPAAGSPFPHR